MTIEEWREAYHFLDAILSDFIPEERNFRNGRNEQIRNDAERKIDLLLLRTDNYIKNNFELYSLITGEDNNDFGRAIAYDEFLLIRYFRRDLGNVLQKIQRKIDQY
ncbi:hypothetical protein [Myroides odoratimimus]|uniref:hypothetical protein n=1 Tax=Myroides odoratimimus TaxID=76832 RepID=UPI003100DDE1